MAVQTIKFLLRPLVRRVWRRPQPTPASRPAEAKRPSASDDPTFLTRKKQKLQRIRSILTDDVECKAEPLYYDFLTEELRQEFNIVDTENVSAHAYDGNAKALIDEFPDGLILDCGAGCRPVYHDNVVNFEICPYDTTDVRGVGERLPFRSGVFDAAFSLAVLEHVRDPFQCAREIIRVLKPGGKLYCAVPFMQPFHAYPHHYYNMTAQGLANLFSHSMDIDKQEVGGGGQPIFMLNAVVQYWAAGLSEETRRQFLEMKLADLAGNPLDYVEKPFVTELAEQTRFYIAATTSLFAHKRAA